MFVSTLGETADETAVAGGAGIRAVGIRAAAPPLDRHRAAR